MKIATFNVNSVRMRLKILEDWLSERKPDILFMQETKTQNINFPELFFSERGYKSFYNGEKSYNGVAALVKDNLNVSAEFGFDDGSFSTRVMTLKLKSLTILNTYVPQGKSIDHKDFEVKKEFLHRVKKIISREKNNLFLWVGDLNVAPEDIDVTHPENKRNHVCMCEEIREVFRDTKGDLVDVLRMLNKNPGVFTFFDYRVKDAVKRNIGWRIDLMLASEKLSEFVKSCAPDVSVRELEKPSDHVPLVGEFALSL